MKSQFRLPLFLVYLVLPRLAFVYGDSVVSVYLQLNLYANRDSRSTSWRKNTCWLGYETLRERTRLSQRVLKRHLNVLVRLGLIEEVWRGHLRTYRLRHTEINGKAELNSLMHILDSQLQRDFTRGTQIELNERFLTLDKMLLGSPLDVITELDVEDVQERVRVAEMLYRGSSLFMLQLLIDGSSMREEERAFRLGCSQSTLSRYISAYEGSGVLIGSRGNACAVKHLELIDRELNPMGVVISNVEKQLETYVCPLCDEGFGSPRALSVHLSREDKRHQLLNDLRKQVHCKPNELRELYERHQRTFDLLKDRTLNRNYMNTSAPCKQTCEECLSEWYDDFFAPCTLKRKTEFITEFGLDERGNVRVNEKIEKKQDNDVAAAFKREVPPPRKKRNLDPDSAPALLGFFYEQVGGKPMNFAKESKQIKNLLVSKSNQLTPDEIRTTLSYMVRRGYTDLRFLTNSVNEALLEKRYIEELDVEGTAPYLVARYYTGMNAKVNVQTLIKDTRHVVETIQASSYEETKQAVDYMIKIRCPTINFIGSKLNELKLSGTFARQEDKIKSNPALTDQGEWVYIRDDLIGARTSLSEVPENYYARALEEVDNIFKERRFRKGYSYLDWAWAIGLDLDSDMFKIAINEEPTVYRDSAFQQWVESLYKRFGKTS